MVDTYYNDDPVVPPPPPQDLTNNPLVPSDPPGYPGVIVRRTFLYSDFPPAARAEIAAGASVWSMRYEADDGAGVFYLTGPEDAFLPASLESFVDDEDVIDPAFI